MSADRIIIIVIVYMVIGNEMHKLTEPRLALRPFKRYTPRNWGTFFLDIFFWLPIIGGLLIYSLIRKKQK